MRWILIALLLISSTGVEARIIERIVAKVNEEIITLSELNGAKRAYAKLKGASPDEISKEEVEEILRMMIQRLLILQEAKREKIEVSRSEIDEALERVRSRFEDEDSFHKALLAQGYTLEDLVEDYKEELMYSKMIDQKIRSNITFTKEELSKIREGALTQIHVRHILLETHQKAKEVIGLLEEGVSFEELASKMSLCPTGEKGGDLGFITKGEMIKEFDEVAFALKDREIGVAKTPFGYHVIQVLSRRPTPVEDLPRLEREAKERAWKKRFDEMMDEWVETLYKEAYIEVNL
jgi:parvulin-like peptidyl-prolyl isomerase